MQNSLFANVCLISRARRSNLALHIQPSAHSLSFRSQVLELIFFSWTVLSSEQSAKSTANRGRSEGWTFFPRLLRQGPLVAFCALHSDHVLMLFTMHNVTFMRSAHERVMSRRPLRSASRLLCATTTRWRLIECCAAGTVIVRRHVLPDTFRCWSGQQGATRSTRTQKSQKTRKTHECCMCEGKGWTVKWSQRSGSAATVQLCMSHAQIVIPDSALWEELIELQVQKKKMNCKNDITGQ